MDSFESAKLRNAAKKLCNDYAELVKISRGTIARSVSVIQASKESVATLKKERELRARRLNTSKRPREIER
jgi:hypothetical protein